MKTVIISDIHGNLEALTSLREECDELWVLGDLVNRPCRSCVDGTGTGHDPPT